MSPQTEASFLEAYEAMLRLWPTKPEARDVTTRAGTTHVNVWGDPSAPPLVMLHGFKVTSTMWAPNAAALGAIRRVYAADTLGDYGFSVAAHPPRKLEELMIWLEELLDSLGLAETDLGGMSYGGWLAANFAARRPARVRRLVLLAPGASFGSFSAQWFLRGIPMIAWKRREFVEDYLRWAGVPPSDDPHYEAVLRGIVDVMFAGHRHFPLFGLPLPARLPVEVLRRIICPTLLLYGESEKMYAPEPAMRLAREHVASVECALIPRASHNLTFAQPARVNDAVTQFLTAAARS